jgi:hypothetical protein
MTVWFHGRVGRPWRCPPAGLGYWGVLGRTGLPGRRGRIRADARDAAKVGERGDHDEQPCKAGPDKHHVHADNNMQGGYGVQELEDTFAGIDGGGEFPNRVIGVRFVCWWRFVVREYFSRTSRTFSLS